MKATIVYLIAVLIVIGSCCGCSPSPHEPKPSPAQRQPDAEKALRDSLSHTHPPPRRK
jgi:hypothetical protein